jgi:predicted metal-dependent HD superfamily phosphohydrolase
MLKNDWETPWQELWRDFGVEPPAGALEGLLERWSEPQRCYHGLEHLRELLTLFGEFRLLALRPAEILAALFFHDAVYLPRRSDNEERSATLAGAVLGSAGVAPATIDRVERLILATRHHSPVNDPDAALLVDLDLAILGSSPERFARYEEQIRAEYSWVPFFLYRHKRRKVLRSFAARERIFTTPALHQRFEEAARRNLA